MASPMIGTFTLTIKSEEEEAEIIKMFLSEEPIPLQLGVLAGHLKMHQVDRVKLEGDWQTRVEFSGELRSNHD